MRVEQIGNATLYLGDCMEVLPTLPRVDAVITDPPYELGFMGKAWDKTGIAYSVEMWRHALSGLKPGGHLLAFSGSRTYHRMACAVEDAGFEIRDQIMWVYGSGFPKSKNLEGGLGTALKPAHEPIVVARKPLIGTVAENVLSHGTGALNIDGGRVGGDGGRWPANLIHDGSDDVTALFPIAGSNSMVSGKAAKGSGFLSGLGNNAHHDTRQNGGTAARFFYCAKAGKRDRGEGNSHPTVKPTTLIEYLLRLVVPVGGKARDHFMGSGTTGVACAHLGIPFEGIEKDPEFFEIACRRIEQAQAQPGMFIEPPKAKGQEGLFA